MSTEEPSPAPVPSPALAGLAAVMPIAALFLGCGLTGLFFVAQPGSIRELGVVGALPLVVFVLAGVVLAALLFLLGRGRSIPTAVVLGVAASPWVVGMLGASWTVLGVTEIVSSADPSMRAMLLARIISQTMMAGATGSLSGGTLLVAAAFGLGVASVAQRAPGRVLFAGGLGFVVTSPLVMVTAYGMVAREYFVLVAVFAAVLVAVGAGLGVTGAGTDARGRSGALASAVPWIGGLGVLALVSAAVHKSTILIFQVVASASSEHRIALMAHGAEELSPMVAARWLVPLAVVLAGLAVAAWAGVKRRPGAMQLLGGVALVIGFTGVIGLDTLTRWQIASASPDRGTTAPPGFEGATVADTRGEPSEPDLYLGRLEIHAADGSGETRSLTEAFQQHRRAVQAAPVWLDTPPELVVALDERVSGEVLSRLSASAREAGVQSFSVSVSSPPTEAQRDALRSATPALWMAAAAFQDSRTLPIVVASEADLERAHSDPTFFHTRLGASVPPTLEARPGVPVERRGLDGSNWGGGDATAAAWVEIQPDATSGGLLTLVAHLHARGLVPVLVDTIPDAAPEGLGLARLGEQLAVMRSGADRSDQNTIGAMLDEAPPGARIAAPGRGETRPPSDGYGRGARTTALPRVRLDRPTVRGSLSVEVVRRVHRRHISEVRYCYERHLMEHPGASGDIELRYVISPEGRVTQPTAISATLPEVASCVGRLVLRWTLPSPDGGGVVIVNQRIELEEG